MNLSEIAYASSAKVPVPGGDLTVRGLSLVDIMTLVADHRVQLEEAFKSLMNDGANAEAALSSAKVMGAELVALLPAVAAHVIALASDQPDASDAAAKLPVGLQLSILERVLELTASMEGGMGKVIEIVVGAVRVNIKRGQADERPATLTEWVWGLRRQVSLLLASGHQHAPFYPLCRVWEETDLVVRRENGLEKTRALLLNQAVSAVLSEKAATRFKETLDSIGD